MKTMKLYHGSKKAFNAFNLSCVGEHATDEGKGIYLTDNYDVACAYATPNQQDMLEGVIEGFVYTVELQIGEILSHNEKRLSYDTCKAFIRILNERTDILSNYGEVNYEGFETVLERATRLEYDSSDNDVDFLCGLVNSSGDIEAVHKLAFEQFGMTHIEVADNQSSYMFLEATKFM